MAGELILIEDNARSRKLARDVLQFKGYQTVAPGALAVTVFVTVRSVLSGF